MRAANFSTVILGAFVFLGIPKGFASPVDIGDQLYAQALNEWDRNDWRKVEGLLRQALALQRSALPATDRRVTETLDHLGRVFYNRGVNTKDPRQFADAIPWFREAVDLMQHASQPDRVLLADYLSDLGAAQREAGQTARGLPIVCDALRIRLSLKPLLVDRITRSIVTLARTRAALGDQQEANNLLHDADAVQTTPSDGLSIGKAAYQRNCETVPIS